MDVLSAYQATGDFVSLKRTDARHYDNQGRMPELQPPRQGNFGELLVGALSGVNDLQQESTQLMQAMITNPDSVDPHDVTIAMAQANLSVSITKAVVDRALRAYSEIINVR
jgi:flagellar hook-basal body complex protein FliE